MGVGIIPGFMPRTRSILGPTGIGTNGQVLTSDGAGGTSWEDAAGGVTDHGALTGLTDDDHTQYALRAGRAGGQTIYGGTTSGNLVLFASSSAPAGITLTHGGDTRVESWTGTVVIGSSSRIAVEATNTLALGEPCSIGWAASSAYTGAKDCGFARDATGVVRTTNGSTGSGDQKMAGLRLVPYTDATRPAAGVAGRVIYNSTDGKLNIDTGTDWTLPDGTVT